MDVQSIENYSVYDYSLVKLTQTGNITQILSLSHKNNSCPIKKLNKDEYVLVDTGEILKCNHIDNRSQNLNTIRRSISNLRDLINNNFVGGSNELWITLTFGEHKIYNSKELCSIFEKFIKRLRYKFKNIKLDYIYVPEPHQKGDWHIHLLLKADSPLYIENSLLNKIWGYGFVKVNRLKDITNIGAYVSAYLINIKERRKNQKRC
ncbi:MAG: replicative protein [Clostridia bacterium]|nr:replicative protein [Clostridia bacterium]